MTEIAASGLHLQGVGHSYGRTAALTDIDLDVPSGSLAVIVGPSGSGKSTLLRLIAGLEEPSNGDLLLDGQPLGGLDPSERSVGMVFQDYALFPHMTVRDNISFGLRMAERRSGTPRLGRPEIQRRTEEVAAMLELTPYLERRPAQLSGGQRQRVALARGIVRRPAMLLLDEPLSALDPQLRTSARAEIVRLHREAQGITLMVTHDQQEAMAIASHLIVMRGGRIEQSGSVDEIYREPRNRFVASFIGSPAMNFCELTDGSEGWRAGDGRILDPGQTIGEGEVEVKGIVDLTSFTGDARELLCRSDSGSFVAKDYSAGVGRGPGASIRVAVPTERFYHFDRNGNRR